MRFSSTITQFQNPSSCFLYENKDHLANVRVVLSDAKLITDNGTVGVVDNADSFEPEVKSAISYYPGGMKMPGTQYYAGNKPRYDYNGKETDQESGWQDYGMRMYMPQINRFPTVDPISDEYPELTPYQFASNSPISGDDIDGLEYNNRTTYVHVNTKIIQSNCDQIQNKTELKSSSFVDGSKGVLKWVGVTLAKNDATRVSYLKEASLLKGKKDFASSKARADLKSKYRSKTPQPMRAILDAKRPIETEMAKVGQGGDPGKTNAKVNSFASNAGLVGVALLSYGVAESASNIYNSENPLQQTAIEGSGWAGAVYGGEAGAEAGAIIGGVPGAVVGGIIGSAAGSVLGKEAMQSLTERKEASAVDRAKSEGSLIRATEEGNKQKDQVQ